MPGFHYQDSYEWLNPLTDEYEELDVILYLDFAPAEPEVGIFDSYVDDYTIEGLTQQQEADLRADQQALDRILERATEAWNQDEPDYPEPDYDDR